MNAEEPFDIATQKGRVVYALVRECLAEAADGSPWLFQARMLQAGLSVNDGDTLSSSKHMAALHWACYYADPAACRFLLHQGANVNARGTAPFFPAGIGSEYIIDNHHDLFVTPTRALSLFLVSPLIMASTIGSLQIVEMLLEAKADVWVRDSLKCLTALDCAVAVGHLDVAWRLIRADALSPLHRLGGRVDHAPLRRALERGLPDEVVYEMVCRDMPTVAFLVAASAPSPVHFAALAAAVGHISKLSPAVSKVLEETPGAVDEVAQLAEQLKVNFARYYEAFWAAEGRELMFL